MLNKLGQFFSPSQPQDLAEETEDTRRAVATVLASAARADSHFAAEECEALVNMFECKLGLERQCALSLLSGSETQAILDEAIDELREVLSLEQRELILGLTWAIIAADKLVETEEKAFAASLRNNLGLTLEQSLRARKIAEGITIDGFKEFVEAYQGAVTSRRPFEEVGDTIDSPDSES